MTENSQQTKEEFIDEVLEGDSGLIKEIIDTIHYPGSQPLGGLLKQKLSEAIEWERERLKDEADKQYSVGLQDGAKQERERILEILKSDETGRVVASHPGYEEAVPEVQAVVDHFIKELITFIENDHD